MNYLNIYIYMFSNPKIYMSITCNILQMVAKGKDASDLFPAVVKNVVSKNLEVSQAQFNHPI